MVLSVLSAFCSSFPGGGANRMEFLQTPPVHHIVSHDRCIAVLLLKTCMTLLQYSSRTAVHSVIAAAVPLGSPPERFQTQKNATITDVLQSIRDKSINVKDINCAPGHTDQC